MPLSVRRICKRENDAHKLGREAVQLRSYLLLNLALSKFEGEKCLYLFPISNNIFSNVSYFCIIVQPHRSSQDEIIPQCH